MKARFCARPSHSAGRWWPCTSKNQNPKQHLQSKPETKPQSKPEPESALPNPFAKLDSIVLQVQGLGFVLESELFGQDSLNRISLAKIVIFNLKAFQVVY
jgi:hypothetical protein